MDSDHPPKHSRSWEDEVAENIRAGCLILGIGNRLRGDDAAGSVVAERLAAGAMPHALDCAEAPENYLARIEQLQPRDVLFVDVVAFGQKPGTVRLFRGETFPVQAVSTHAAGLAPLMGFIAASVVAECWVLAIQPADVTYGAALSQPVQKAVEEIVTSPVWRRLKA